jgi:endonuclease YncB( thermonuclease family)
MTRPSFLIFLVSLLFFHVWGLAQETNPPSPPPNLRSVDQVIDGGTLVLNGGEVVKLIGVQAPTKPSDDKPHSAAMGWWRQSQQFVASIVQNRKVWLEYDPNVKTDAQGNTWAYVYFTSQGGSMGGAGGVTVLSTAGTYMLNRLVLRYGMANSGNPFPFTYRAEFNQLEREARNQQIGLFQQAF